MKGELVSRHTGFVKSTWIKEIRQHTLTYLSLFIILAVSLFVRVYRTEDLLRFYYDQGRDALVIWELWHNFKPFLIGPVTGLKGIFLGPFYYYLIAPFYLFGGGSPVYPSVFISFTSVVASLFMYVLGLRMHSRLAGLLAALIASFSYNIFTLSRWLSNPTPMLLLSVVIFWCYWEIISRDKKEARWFWFFAIFFTSVSMHFESASAVFYIPILFIFMLWQRKKLPYLRYLAGCMFVFFAGFIPQIIFNIRHDNILLNNIMNLFLEDKAFRGITKFIFEERLKFFWSAYSGKILAGYPFQTMIAVVVSASAYFFSFDKFRKRVIPLFSIFFIVPAVGYLFFQGNYGNMYDYYLIGYFLPLILFFAIGVAEVAHRWGGVIFLFWFLYFFVTSNFILIKNYLSATPETRPISLEDELAAVSWVFDDSKKCERKDIEELEDGKTIKTCGFNIDVYVPPVIPYSYDYLFLWQGTKRCGRDLCGLVKDVWYPTVYTVFEADPPHPERLEAWLERQEGVGEVVKEVKFGQVTVQKRHRYGF